MMEMDMTLYEFLIIEKGYTEHDASEACIRWFHGMEIPTIVRDDIKNYYD